MVPNDVEAVVAMLASQARDWIVAQRDRYRPNSSALPSEVVSALAAFYEPQTLRNAQYVTVAAMDNPPFYADLRRAAPGIPLIDFSLMNGITFDDTIVILGPALNATSLFFHELVHVVQYSRLRPAAFAARYVRGWALNGMQYSNIPLELDAYSLQARFDSAGAPFSVEDEVAKLLSSRSAT